MRQFAYVAFAGGLVLAAVVPAGAQQSTRPAEPGAFTAAERARLDRGDLVVRRTTSVVRGHKMVGGSAWIRVRRPPQVVYRAATDYARWTRFVPRATEARLVANGRNVLVRHAYGPVDARYELRVRAQQQTHDVSFTLDPSRPHTIEAAWGYLRVRPYEGGSLLSYGVMIDVGDGLVRTLFEGEVHRWALRVPAELRRWVESREASRRYGR